MKTWAQINFQRVKYVRYAELKVRQQLTLINVQYANRVKELGELALNDLSEANIKEQIEAVYIDFYTVTGVAFARNEMRVMKFINNRLTQKQSDEVLESIWARQMREFARTRCAVRIQEVTRNIFKDIENVTKDIYVQVAESGWGAERAAQEILTRMKSTEVFRAMRIARTEIVSASNEGSYMGAGSFGIEVNKSWVPTSDSRTRPEHEDMANQAPIPLSEKFIVMGEHLDYPGDPSGTAENVIQCRCGVVYEPVNSLIDQLLSE